MSHNRSNNNNYSKGGGPYGGGISYNYSQQPYYHNIQSSSSDRYGNINTYQSGYKQSLNNGTSATSSYVQFQGESDYVEQGYVKKEHSTVSIPPASTVTSIELASEKALQYTARGSYSCYNQNDNYGQLCKSSYTPVDNISTTGYINQPFTNTVDDLSRAATSDAANTTASYCATIPVPAPATSTSSSKLISHGSQESIKNSNVIPIAPTTTSSVYNPYDVTKTLTSSNNTRPYNHSLNNNGRYPRNSSHSYSTSGQSGRGYSPTPNNSSSLAFSHNTRINDKAIPSRPMEITNTSIISKTPNEYSAWILIRLMQLKREGVTFKAIFGNIIDLGFDSDELKELLTIGDVPESVLKLANDENVKLSTEIREKFSSVLKFIEKQIGDGQEKEQQEQTDEQNTGNTINKRPREDEKEDDIETITQNKKRCLAKIPYPPPLPVFNNSDLEDCVLKHRSISGLNKQNNRFRFKGEGLLKSVCLEICFERYPDYSLDEIKLLNSLVFDDDTLSNWAYSYKFQDHFHLDEVVFSGKESDITLSRLFANLFKEYVGALFLDYNGDISKFKIWLECLVLHRLKTIDLHNELEKAFDHAKSLKIKHEQEEQTQDLSIFSSSNSSSVNSKSNLAISTESNITSASSDLHSKVYPAYQVEYPVLERLGSDNAPVFRVGCVINGEIIGISSYSNIKTAKQLAAKDAFDSNTSKVKKYISLNNEYKRTKRTFVLPPVVNIPIEDQIPVMYGDLTGLAREY